MNYLYENHDILNAPYEAFLFDASREIFPVRAHWHYFVELIYIIEGIALVECDQKEYLACVGDMLFFYAGDVHAIYTASEMPLRYLVLKFDSNRLAINSNYTPKLSAILQYAKRSGQADTYFPASRLQHLPVKERFETCIQEICGKEYGYDIRIHGEISSLLIEIIRIWQTDGLQIRELAPLCAETESSLRNITEFIDRHSHEPVKVEELADMCHMSYSHFAKCFKELYGRSCKDYIELIRIEKGEELLLFTDSSLSVISQEIGFADCSHFIRTFRKWKDTTPGKYRSSHRHDH